LGRTIDILAPFHRAKIRLRTIVAKWNDNTEDWSYIFKDWNFSDKLSIQLSESIFDDLAALEGSSSIPIGTWVHVATTYASSDGIVRLYFNGVEDASLEVGPGRLIDSSLTDLLIGAVFTGGGVLENFAGLIDEVTIYNRALSAAEIQAIFNAGSAGKCKETELCTLNLTPSIIEGTLMLDVQLGTQAPATWNVWLIAQAEVTPLVSAALPVIAPPASVELDLPFFPALGTIGVLTTLTTPDTGIICSVFSTVDSGPPLAASISLKELMEPHAVKLHDQLRQQHIR
jgi:hypothetical protein